LRRGDHPPTGKHGPDEADGLLLIPADFTALDHMVRASAVAAQARHS
jgi:hypothetical protein